MKTMISNHKFQKSNNVLAVIIFSCLCLFSAFVFLPVASKQINNLIYWGCFLPVLIWKLGNPKKTIIHIQSEIPLLIFLLSTLIFSLIGSSYGQAKSAFYLLLFWLTLTCMGFWRRQSASWVFLFFSISSIIALTASTYLWFSYFANFESYIRVKLWDVLNPNETSLLIVTAIVGIWEFYGSQKILEKNKFLYFSGFASLCLIVGWSAIILQSRSSLLGFLAYFALKLILESRRALHLSALLAAAIFFWGVDLHQLLLNRGESHRIAIWMDAWRHLHDACGIIFGCGSDPYKIAGRFFHPHSAYFSMLYYNGIIAFFIFMSFLYYCFIKGIKHQSKWLYLAAVGFGGLLTTSGGVIHSPEPYWIYFWLPLFLILIEAKQSEKTQNQ